MKWEKASRKHLWWGVGAAGVLLAAGAVVLVVRSAGPVVLPPEFLAARRSAALTSAQIVSLTNQTDDTIKQVNFSDLGGDSTQALALIENARSANREAYSKAFELTGYLQTLAGSLQAIPPGSGQGVAYEAVSVELSLVSEFILYTQQLNGFLDALGKAITSGTPADRSAAQAALAGVNTEVTKIDTINQQFLSKMQEFDQSLQ